MMIAENKKNLTVQSRPTEKGVPPVDIFTPSGGTKYNDDNDGGVFDDDDDDFGDVFTPSGGTGYSDDDDYFDDYNDENFDDVLTTSGGIKYHNAIVPGDFQNYFEGTLVQKHILIKKNVMILT